MMIFFDEREFESDEEKKNKVIIRQVEKKEIGFSLFGFLIEPKKEDISPTGRTQEKPFSKKNINHKW